MRVLFYHNPKCSKSRDALNLLRKKGIEPEIILYLINPPTPQELSIILKKLGMEARQLVRFKEEVAQKLGIHATDTRSSAEWVNLMVENPILIERPIVITDRNAVIGRPPELVLKLLTQT